MASEDQLSGNTFAFAHVARTPFRSLPSFTGAEHEVRQLSAPAQRRVLRRGMHSPGDCIPWAPSSPKPTKILLQRVQITSAWCWAKGQVFSSSWLIPAGSNPSCLLTFPSNFSFPSQLDPSQRDPMVITLRSLPFPLLYFLLWSARSALPRKNFSAISPGVSWRVPLQLASVRKWLYLAWSITLVLIIKSGKRKKGARW